MQRDELYKLIDHINTLHDKCTLCDALSNNFLKSDVKCMDCNNILYKFEKDYFRKNNLVDFCEGYLCSQHWLRKNVNLGLHFF
jgi:hypothetical protein